MTDTRKNAILVRFCRGESATEIAQRDGLIRSTVEQVIREALAQLVRERTGIEVPVGR